MGFFFYNQIIPPNARQNAAPIWYSEFPIPIQTETPMKTKLIVSVILLAGLLSACQKDEQTAAVEPEVQAPATADVSATAEAEGPSRFDIYADVGLTTDLGHLSDGQKP